MDAKIFPTGTELTAGYNDVVRNVKKQVTYVVTPVQEMDIKYQLLLEDYDKLRRHYMSVLAKRKDYWAKKQARDKQAGEAATPAEQEHYIIDVFGKDVYNCFTDKERYYNKDLATTTAKYWFKQSGVDRVHCLKLKADGTTESVLRLGYEISQL